MSEYGLVGFISHYGNEYYQHQYLQDFWLLPYFSANKLYNNAEVVHKTVQVAPRLYLLF